MIPRLLPANVFGTWHRTLRAGLAAVVLIGLGAGAAAYYRMELQRAEQLVGAELAAIGELKAVMAGQWRSERLGDARILMDRPFFSEAVTTWMRVPTPEQAEQLRDRFRTLQLAYGYLDILLLDRDGHPRLSLLERPAPLTADDRDAVSAALRTRQPVLTPLHREGDTAVPRIDVIAPLLPEGNPLGAIVLIQDARATLYPLLALWPLRGIIGTTSIKMHEGGAVFRISPSRPDGEGDGPRSRSPATPHDDATIQAHQPVPGSPWLLITEVERDGVLATARGQAVQTLLAVASLLALLGASGLMLWQRRQKRLYQALYAAEAARRETDVRYELVLEAIEDGVWDWDLRTQAIFLSPRWKALLGYSSFHEPSGADAALFGGVHPEDRDRVRDALQRHWDGHADYRAEFRLRDRNGRYRWVLSRGRALRDEAGKPLRMLGAVTDISERKAAEDALLCSERQVREQRDELTWIYDHAPIGLCLLDRNLCYKRINRWLAEINGLSVEAHNGRSVREVLPELCAHVEAVSREILATGRAVINREFAGETPARPGLVRYWNGNGFPVFDQNGVITGFGLVVEEITERKCAERQLRDSEERFRLFMDNSPTLAWMKDAHGRYVYVSQTWERWLAIPLADWYGKTDAELWPDATARQLHDNDLEVLVKDQAIQTTETVPDPGGSDSHWRVAKFPFRDASGNRFVGGIGLEVTAEWQREEALRASEERLSLAQQAGGIAIWDSDLASHRATLSESYRRLFGLPEDAPCGYGDFLDRVHPDDRATVDAAFQAALAGAGRYEQEFRIVRDDDGMVLWVAGKGQVNFAADGTPVRAMGVVYDITQRKRAEERLQCALNEATDERMRLEAVMEALPVGVSILDSQGGYVRSNQAFERIWGGPRPSVRSVADYGAYRAWWVQTGQPVQPEEWASAQAIRTRAPVVGQRLQIERFDGSKVIVLNSAAPVLTGSGMIAGCAIAIMDISESVAQAEALRESERIFRAIGESIDYGVWICTPDGRNTYASESFLKLVGLTRAQCSDFGWGEVLHPEDADRTLAAWQHCVRTGAQWDIEHRFRGVDGQYHPVLARGVRVLDEDGKVLCWAGINLDIGRLKQAEDALRDADRRKDEFLATLAHELRNPLAPICAVLDALRDSGIQEPNFPQLREILERQTRQLVRLVDDLLEVSRITRGRIELQKERCTVATLVAQALETSQPLIRSASHSVTVTLPPEALQVDGDPVRLTQVFCNLLNNAAKYMAAGGTIHVAAERQGDEAVVRIRDEGMGIAAQHLGQVFDLFGQVQCTSKLSQGGLGIGLHLVQRLVELHGGRVAAHSAGPGQGSEFTVILPLAAPGTPLTASPAPPWSGPQSAQRVLIVDDNRDAADTLALLVQTLGGTTEVAYDGAAALDILVRFRPGVVLLDLGMPLMDGFEVARRIRQSAAGFGVTLVAVSGWGQEEDRRQTREAGFDHHVVKPIDFAELQRLLEPPDRSDK